MGNPSKTDSIKQASSEFPHYIVDCKIAQVVFYFSLLGFNLSLGGRPFGVSKKIDVLPFCHECS
jgi:hypothetical protein